MIGAEIEYWVVNERGNLSSAAGLARELDFAEQEFVEPVLEIKTRPAENAEELEEEINRNVAEAVELAVEKDLHIVPLATPLDGDIETVPSERFRLQEKIVGEDLKYAKHVAGFHLHLEQDETLEQLNRLTALDPALALTSSSPYYNREKIASSARNLIYRFRCYSGFPRHGQLWNYADTLEGWERRIDLRFRELQEAARRKGIDTDSFESEFQPESSIWTPVRLRNRFNTVEWRAPDTALPSQLVELAREVERFMDRDIQLPEFGKVRERSEEAIEKGMTPGVRDYLEELGVKTRRFRPMTEEFSSKKLDGNETRELRLKYAEKLEEDIKSL